jgi:UDPglucose--hexose-1-phosphate uridylyltransferase
MAQSMKPPARSEVVPQVLQSTAHRRFNPLTREWVLVSPHRSERPWQGQTEPAQAEPSQAYDPNCYLCPGNVRAGGQRNPLYIGTFAFNNDFAALQPETSPARLDLEKKGIVVAQTESGICRVVCFSPRHDLTLSQMPPSDIRSVVDVWVEEFESLQLQPSVNYVQIFENRGLMMGCSNPHPHGQIWATSSVPNEPRKERESFSAYQTQHKTCLLCDYIKLEASGERLVCANVDFMAVVPFWAIWPYELLVVSKRHLGCMSSLTETERASLADILKCVTTRYDSLFQTSCPYSMGFHQQPTDGEEHNEWHFHAHFYPPLLRSASIRKFMVGFEMLGSPQRDFTPEYAAERLRQAEVRTAK